MKSGIVYTCGLLGSLESALSAGVAGARLGDPLQPVSVLVPSNLLAVHLRRVLSSGRGHANVHFETLVDLARRVAEPLLLAKGLKEVSMLGQRILIREVLGNAVSDGSYFSPVRAQPGFEAALLSAFQDLLEARISPEELDTIKADAKFRELGAAYRAYLETLSSLNLIQREGIMEASLDCLNGLGEPPIFIYGFYDFTPLQRAFIEGLAQVRDLLVFFPYRSGQAFAYALPTISWFRSLGFRVNRVSTDEAGTDLATAQNRILELPQTKEEAHNDGTLEVISAPGEEREVREIARRVLDFAREEIAFAEMGVFLRQPRPYTRLLSDAFGNLGIPFNLVEGPSLAESPAALALSLFEKLLASDYRRDRVMEFLTLLRLPDDPVSRWDRVSARAGVVAGRAEWQERLSRATGSKDEEERKSASDLLRFMHGVWGLVDILPESGSWGSMVAFLHEVMGALTHGMPGDDQIVESLESLLDLGSLKKEVSKEEFFSTLESLFSSTPTKRGRTGEGVSIVNLMSGRGLTFRIVFIPGMAERFFPNPVTQDPILLDHERREISMALAKELPDRSRGPEEERLLFALALLAAQERAVLSFPRLDPATGKEKIPSFFVMSLSELFQKPEESRARGPGALTRYIPLSRQAPARTEECLDRLEFGLCSAVKARAESNPEPLSYLAGLSPFYAQALRFDRELWQEETLGPWDGILAGREALELWGREAPLSFSPSGLETYAKCPLHYFLQNVLEVALIERPEEVEVLTARDKGWLVHRILYQLFLAMKEKGMLPLTHDGRTEADQLLDQVASREFASFQRIRVTGSRPIWELKKREIIADIQKVIAELEGEAEMIPDSFEVSFDNIPYALKSGDEIFLRGKIDRLDISSAGSGRIVDYKTGKYKKIQIENIQRGEALQVPLYLAVAENLFPGISLFAGEYVYASEKGRFKRNRFDPSDQKARNRLLQEAVTRVVLGVWRGNFCCYAGRCDCLDYGSIRGRSMHLILKRKEGALGAGPIVNGAEAED